MRWSEGWPGSKRSLGAANERLASPTNSGWLQFAQAARPSVRRILVAFSPHPPKSRTPAVRKLRSRSELSVPLSGAVRTSCPEGPIHVR